MNAASLKNDFEPKYFRRRPQAAASEQPAGSPATDFVSAYVSKAADVYNMSQAFGLAVPKKNVLSQNIVMQHD